MNTPRPQYDPAKKQDSALEVFQAQIQGQALVALESAILTHGLIRPHNLTFAQDIEQAVRHEGAVPATVGVLEGKVMVGMGQIDLERLLAVDDPLKISTRNFATAILQESSGGTTLAGTMFAAHQKEIKVVAAGGIGGVQTEPRFDISSDLQALAQTPMVVVCSGTLSIMDISATVEYLETMGVPVIGYQNDKFPEFLTPGKNLPVSVRLETVEEIGKFARYHWGLGLKTAVLVCQPISASDAVEPGKIETAIAQATADATKQRIRGPLLTPFLLKRIDHLTGGKSTRANQALAISNAKVAAQIARELAGLERLQNPVRED